MKYVIEYQIGGEITIDTGDTDWSAEELRNSVAMAIDDAESAALDRMQDEFDDCEVDGEVASEYKLRRI